MTPEGMGHALEEVWRLLRPGGTLIDLHPGPQSWVIEVHQGAKVVFAESWRGADYCDEDVQRAEKALAQAAERRLFVVERSTEFDLRCYGSSLAELQDYLAQENAYADKPEDAASITRAAELAARVEAIRQAAGLGAEVAYYEQGRIARLRPVADGWT